MGRDWFVRFGALAIATGLGVMGATTPSQAALMWEHYPGNDCGPCSISDELADLGFDESPFLIKFNDALAVDDTGDLSAADAGKFTINVTSEKDGEAGESLAGTWSYTPAEGDPQVVYWVVKYGNGDGNDNGNGNGGPPNGTPPGQSDSPLDAEEDGFGWTLFWMEDDTGTPVAVTSGDWAVYGVTPGETSDLPGQGLNALSHISFYDGEGDDGGIVETPEPLSIALLGAGLIGLGGLRLRARRG